MYRSGGRGFKTYDITPCDRFGAEVGILYNLLIRLLPPMINAPISGGIILGATKRCYDDFEHPKDPPYPDKYDGPTD
ncbi:hypothetical protein EV137_7210 [Kribbella pratensis]|uniref:Uncharacterized protein n=1 Tax=Kribbella pratensis TaxID=2512112 RepID=A0ABY2F804_9ACTN|nr:hypothetical protein [Kribbella pratensis]TDW84399.1 hypothetical protein EV137_7210 [Kribbella pratensis]